MHSLYLSHEIWSSPNLVTSIWTPTSSAGPKQSVLHVMDVSPASHFLLPQMFVFCSHVHMYQHVHVFVSKFATSSAHSVHSCLQWYRVEFQGLKLCVCACCLLLHPCMIKSSAMAHFGFKWKKKNMLLYSCSKGIHMNLQMPKADGVPFSHWRVLTNLREKNVYYT